MARVPYVTFEIRWEAEEPDDATPCAVCGEVAWLRRWRAVLDSDVIGLRRGLRSCWIVCDACRDAAV